MIATTAVNAVSAVTVSLSLSFSLLSFVFCLFGSEGFSLNWAS